MNQPQIGDYVICEEYENESRPRIRQYTLNNIGQCVKLDNSLEETRYGIKYDNVPENLLSDFSNELDHINGVYICIRYMKRGEIKFFSKNPEELKIIIDTNKYNL